MGQDTMLATHRFHGEHLFPLLNLDVPYRRVRPLQLHERVVVAALDYLIASRRVALYPTRQNRAGHDHGMTMT